MSLQTTIDLSIFFCYHKPSNQPILNSSCWTHRLQEIWKLLITGDFNYPLISWTSEGGTITKSDHNSEIFLDIINSHCLFQRVLYPTFGNNQLDLIFTDDPNIIYNFSVIAPLGCTNKDGLHHALQWELSINTPKQQSTIPRLNYTYGDYANINSYLSSIDWSNILIHNKIDTNYDLIRHHYIYACSKFIPMKRTPSLRKSSNKWLNTDVKKAIRLKHKAFARLQHCSKARYPKFRKDFNSATRNVKNSIVSNP